MALRLAELLLLTLIQGEIILSFPSSNDGVISLLSSADLEDNVPDAVVGCLPSQYNNTAGVKKSKTKRSTQGREVTIPSGVVESMANTPFSAVCTDLTHVQQEIVDTHNKYRREINAKNMLKLVWNEEAAKTALEWASKCLSGHSPTSQRRITNFKCGENTLLFGFLLPWYAVIDAWHSEGVDYTYGTDPPDNVEVGHYTQMMWATSSQIGCAVALCPLSNNFKYVFVCHYGPPGNKGGKKYPWIPGESCENCPSDCEDKLCTNGCNYQDFFGNCNQHSQTCASDPAMKDSNCPGTCKCTKGEIK